MPGNLSKKTTCGAAHHFAATRLQVTRSHIETRNLSILAHGFFSVTLDAWKKLRTFMEEIFLPMLLEETKAVDLQRCRHSSIVNIPGANDRSFKKIDTTFKRILTVPQRSVSQFSSVSSGIREKWRALPLTSTRSCESAIDAISRSAKARGFPCCSRRARRLPQT